MNSGIRSTSEVFVAVVRIRYDNVEMSLPSLLSKVQGSVDTTTFAGNVSAVGAATGTDAAIPGLAVGPDSQPANKRIDNPAPNTSPFFRLKAWELVAGGEASPRAPPP